MAGILIDRHLDLKTVNRGKTVDELNGAGEDS
jgi:hypothetical protein